LKINILEKRLWAKNLVKKWKEKKKSPKTSSRYLWENFEIFSSKMNNLENFFLLDHTWQLFFASKYYFCRLIKCAMSG
jgi:hypothetical protein